MTRREVERKEPMKPSELMLPYGEWKALEKPDDPDFRSWLCAWERYDLLCSPMQDDKRRLLRFGHFVGWLDALANHRAQEKALNEHPYLDATRFPLSTQKGLTLQQQKLIDTVNHDVLLELQEQGEPLNDCQKAVWAELEAKRQL
jgi:hypothetical protein